MLRHCAYCLMELKSPKLCAGCHRRAYCSRECQATDWVPGRGGQGHKRFCSVPHCCEEDLEWEVGPAGDKGVGVFAKKPISKYSIVIIDGERPDDCPFFADLPSLTGSLQEKKHRFALEITSEFVDGARRRSNRSAIYLRVGRFNHACDANVCSLGDGADGVSVLVACRDIKAGEELLFSYMVRGYGPGFKFPGLHSHRQLCLERHGIVCPADCCCKDKVRDMKIVQAHEDFEKIHNMTNDVETKRKNEAFQLIQKHYECVTEHDLANIPNLRIVYLATLLSYVGLCYADDGVDIFPFFADRVEELLFYANKYAFMETLKKLADIHSSNYLRLQRRRNAFNRGEHLRPVRVEYKAI